MRCGHVGVGVGGVGVGGSGRVLGVGLRVGCGFVAEACVSGRIGGDEDRRGRMGREYL